MANLSELDAWQSGIEVVLRVSNARGPGVWHRKQELDLQQESPTQGALFGSQIWDSTATFLSQVAVWSRHARDVQ